MTQPGMNVDPAQVRRHALLIDEVATMVDEAVAAGGHVRAGNESYGKLVGWIFTPPLNHFADTYLTAGRDIVTATQRQADALRATADEAVASDQRSADRLGGD
ncbi:type VII secretion target [Actinoplanes sp. NPDC049596]|uniref:type VII secretion target n=1 Tax=unclassified Actinoplanes TaxID=2626549 RepID=UPI00342B1995